MTRKLNSKAALEASFPPLWIEVVAEGTGIGKTMAAQRMRDQFDDRRVPNVMVRVESSRLPGALRSGDVSIATEELTRVETTPGGIVGIVSKGLQEISRIASEGGVVIWDWPGSFGALRQEILIRANLDAVLQKKGIAAFSFVVTTNLPERLAEAQRLLEVTAKIAPGFKRVLVRNCYVGPFTFANDSAPARSLAAAEAASSLPSVTLPRIADTSLATLRPTGLSVREIIDQDPEVLAVGLGQDEFTTAACVSAVAAWYERSGREFGKILPFQPEAEPLSAAVAASSHETSAA